jgi:hypothetical protein
LAGENYLGLAVSGVSYWKEFKLKAGYAFSSQMFFCVKIEITILYKCSLNYVSLANYV